MGGGQGGPGGAGTAAASEARDVVAEVKARLAQGKTLAEVPIDDLVQAAEDLGKHLVDERLNTTQIRKFLTQVNKLSADFRKSRSFERERVVLLKPKLAYAAGQHDAVRPLAAVLVDAIDRVVSDRDYERFARFVEAVVAYHRFYGGKDS